MSAIASQACADLVPDFKFGGGLPNVGHHGAGIARDHGRGLFVRFKSRWGRHKVRVEWSQETERGDGAISVGFGCIALRGCRRGGGGVVRRADCDGVDGARGDL